MIRELDGARHAAAGALFAAAAAWPMLFGAAQRLLATPYERALQEAWCGGAPHGALAMLGHCPACWIGGAAFAAAALIALAPPRRAPRKA